MTEFRSVSKVSWWRIKRHICWWEIQKVPSVFLEKTRLPRRKWSTEEICHIQEAVYGIVGGWVDRKKHEKCLFILDTSQNTAFEATKCYYFNNPKCCFISVIIFIKYVIFSPDMDNKSCTLIKWILNFWISWKNSFTFYECEQKTSYHHS